MNTGDELALAMKEEGAAGGLMSYMAVKKRLSRAALVRAAELLESAASRLRRIAAC